MAKPTAPSGALAATRIAGYDASLSDLAVRARIKTLISPSSPANIPSCLKSQSIWYPSRFTLRPDGNLGKPPCDRQGEFATRWQYESNWMSFDEAVGLNMDGVGIVIHKALGLTGIDFDHCVVDGLITDPWVAQKVKELNSYTEYSVSGTGIHVLVWGRLPWAKFTGRIEMKDRSGFLTLTGNRVPGTPAEIRAAQETIDAIHLEVFGAPEQILGTEQNQQLNPNPNTSLPREEERRGEKSTQRSYIQPAEKLNSDDWERLDNLQDKKPNFRSTWEMTRSAGFWPFPSGRYTSSEYELAIASFLVKDGWNEQSILDAICVWRRKHGFKRRMEYCRYAGTLAKAFATVTPRSKRAGRARKESQGLYKHAETKERILGCIIETPRTPKQIAKVTGITQATVYVVLGRLRKDNKVIRDRHTYLCTPTAVPWYMQKVPDELVENYDAEQEDGNPVSIADLDAIEAEYQEFLATEESKAAIISIMPDVEDTEAIAFHEPPPPAEDPYVFTWPVGVVEQVYAKEEDTPADYARYRREMAAWEIQWSKYELENQRKARACGNGAAQLKRHAAAKKRARWQASLYAPSPQDLYLEKINAGWRPTKGPDTL